MFVMNCERKYATRCRFVLQYCLCFSFAVTFVLCAPVVAPRSRTSSLNGSIKNYRAARIKSVLARTSSSTTRLTTLERRRAKPPHFGGYARVLLRKSATRIPRPRVNIESRRNNGVLSATKGDASDSSSAARYEDDNDEEVVRTKTLNGPMIMKRRGRSVSFIVPRKRKLQPLEVGTIPTNVPVLNTSLSIVRHPAFSNGELFCHIKGVCRLGNGRYMLPAWMSQYSEKIAGCGMTNVLYVMHEGESRNLTDVMEDGTPRRVIHLIGFPRETVNVSDEFRNVDILGGDPPRSNWDELVADLTPRILLGDMFLRSDAYNKTVASTCYKEDGVKCDIKEIYPDTLNVSLLVDVGISAVKEHKWTKGVIRLLRNGFEGSLLVTDLADIYGFRFRNQASCFRSILTTNATLASFNATHTMKPDNFMYRANAISREPVINLRKMDGRRCDLKVILLDRVEQGKIYGLNTLKQAISMLNVRLTKRFPTASVQSEAVYFQNISFHEQISVLQEADIAVAAHSEVIANMLFLRPSATFFEILPFGIPPDYRTLADAYDLRYFQVDAQPDSDMFRRCIIHYNDGIDDERKMLLNTWNNEVDKYFVGKTRNGTVDRQAFYLPIDGKDESMGELRNIRRCATLQRVTANVKHLAIAVFKVAMEKCGIRSETAHKQVFF